MKYLRLLTVVVLFSQSAFTQMAGWNHVDPILVQENSGTTVLNYQLPIIVNTADDVLAGEMNATGNDIRFTSQCNGGVEFNYWIESGMNTAATKIWVKIDTLTASSYRTIYMHWGNASATGISAINGTFFGPHSATDSVSGGAAGGVTDSQRGIRFAANEDLLVTAFGKNEPNGSTRYITLFDVATQGILRQQQIAGPAAQYTYADMASPIWLTQGTQYILEMHQSSTDGYYFGPSTTQIGQHLTYLDMRYCNGCNQNTFPTNYLNSIHYGYPDMWYYSKTNVTPAPTYTMNAYELAPLSDSIYVCLNDSVTLNMNIHGGQPPFVFSWTNTAITDPAIQLPDVFPSSDMTYYVTSTDACGVVRNDSIYVEVKALPVFNLDISNALICNGESSELTVDGDYDYSWSTGETNDTITVSPGVTTAYTVTATDEFICSTASSVEVAVNVPLTATHNVAICANETYQVGSHIYSNAGTYIDTLAGITSCDSIVTNIITVNPLPTATHNVSICFGTSLQVGNNAYSVAGTYVDTLTGFATCDSIITTVLTVQDDIDAEIQQIGTFVVADFGADSYQWIDCNTNQPISGENTSSMEITANGSYACVLTINGCDKQSDCLLIDDLSLAEESDLSGISIYPNPANGVVNIYSGINQQVTILDANARELRTIELNMNETKSISITELSSGVYFIRHGKFVSRLVVQ
jgi:hypothetical protein